MGLAMGKAIQNAVVVADNSRGAETAMGAVIGIAIRICRKVAVSSEARKPCILYCKKEIGTPSCGKLWETCHRMYSYVNRA